MKLPFGWLPLDEPLPVIGVVGVGALAAPLLARAEGAGLQMVKGPDITVLLGPAEDLPFLDGVVYLAQNPTLAELLHPPMIVPDVDPALVLAALQRTLDVVPPLVCLPRQGLVVSVARPRGGPA